MNLFNRFRNLLRSKPHYQLQQVFTPTSYAELTYTRRLSLEERLKSALFQPGKQILIYGHSGSGKSTLLHNVLKETNTLGITSQCINDTTVDALMLDAFDKLNPYYIDTVSKTDRIAIANELKTDYGLISAAVKSSYEMSNTVGQKRFLPPQLTPQRLASFIGAARYVWIIEDFHKVVQDEKVKLAQIMKLFVDMANKYNTVRIITIGAAETGSELVECDSELNNRVAEIGIPLLNPTEIMDILSTGTELLNIQFADELKEKIVKYSNCLATIAHQLAYNLCHINKIYKSQKEVITLQTTELEKALSLFISDKENTFDTLYRKITEQRRGKYHNVELILKAMVELPGDEIFHHDILLKICENNPDYPPGNLSFYLKKLLSSECDEVLRLNAGRYSFSDPFFKAYIRMIYGLTKDIKVDDSSFGLDKVKGLSVQIT